MKRVTNIQLENYRAFYGIYDPINLPNGENLLLYGENGSGKSSLFKALNHFFQSSRNAAFVFEENSHATLPVNASIRMNFVDVDAAGLPIAGSDQLLSFTNNISDHNVLFVQNTDLIKGFFDYRSLLKVYYENNTNIFDLIVNEILFETIPAGETEGIGVQLKNINSILAITDRRYNDHWDAIDELPGFETMLRAFLRRLFLKLNRMLIDYFKMNLRLWFVLEPIQFNHAYGVWKTTQELRLEIKLNGRALINHNEYLNEARLSAIAICLYLAGLKINPANFEYKILFLDDVFIGLDASNRIPILKILKREFADYQIIIATHDRHWFELSQRFFKKSWPNKWLFDNLYVGRQSANNTVFDKPILVQGDNDYNKAVYYLHHPDSPDYPAAANYFRKYSEELLSTHLPTQEIRNEDYSIIESYKLTSLVNSGLHFLNKIGADNGMLTLLDRSLPTLLHPLSHFNLASPIYKGELIDIQNCLLELEKHLIKLKNMYRIFIPQGRLIKLNFSINANDVGYYDIFTKEPIYLLQDEASNLTLSTGSCHSKTCYVISGVNRIHGRNFNANDPTASYTSIQDAYNNIFAVINAQPAYAHIAQAAQYNTEFLVNDGNAWVAMNTLMVW